MKFTLPRASEWSTRWTYGLLITTTTLWGSAFAASKVAVASVPPSVAALLRFGLGAVFMMLFLRTRKRELRSIPGSAWPGVALLGAVGVAAYNGFFFWGLHFSAASDGSMIIPTMSPVITVILTVILLKEKTTKHQAAGLLVALAGSALFFYGIPTEESAYPNRLLGNLFFLVAAACWSVYTLYGNRVLRKLDPLPVTAYAMCIGAVLLGILAAPDLGKVAWNRLGPDFWILQFYLAVFPTVLANWFYYLGVKNIGAARASVFMYIVPVSGLVLAGWILGETLTAVQMAGSALMIVGVWLVNRRRNTVASDHDPGVPVGEGGVPSHKTGLDGKEAFGKPHRMQGKGGE